MFEWCEQCEKAEVTINRLIRENAELKAELETIKSKYDAENPHYAREF